MHTSLITCCIVVLESPSTEQFVLCAQDVPNYLKGELRVCTKSGDDKYDTCPQV